MKVYRKAAYLEAVQFTWPPSEELIEFAGHVLGEFRYDGYARAEVEIRTLEDGYDGRVTHIATNGDWIVKGYEGEFWPVKPSIFEQSYVVIK